jgi:hypothetical protein
MASQPITQGPSQVIERDIACVRCEYNLRTLATSGLCPECGLEVARTLAAMEVADARWLRRMSWGLRCFFLAAAFGLQLVDVWWDRWRSGRQLFWGTILIGLVWVVTVRIPNWLGRSAIPHARGIARAAITGMVPMFLWCCWRQYDRHGTQALIGLLLIVGLVACFAHLADVARHLKLDSLARPLLGVAVLLVAGMMPTAIGYWGFIRFRTRPPFDQMPWYYAGEFVYMGGWAVAVMLVGRILCRLDQIQGIGVERSPIGTNSAARVRWGIVLVGTMPLIVFLSSTHPIVWSWQVAFLMSIVAYVAGLWLIASDTADRSGMRMAVRICAIVMLLSSVVPFAIHWKFSLYVSLTGFGMFHVHYASWVLSVCLSFLLLRGIATRLGYGALARSLAVRGVMVPVLLVLSYVLVRLLSGQARREAWEVVRWIVLLATLESSIGLGRLIQAMVESTRVVDNLTAYEGSRGEKYGPQVS